MADTDASYFNLYRHGFVRLAWHEWGPESAPQRTVVRR